VITRDNAFTYLVTPEYKFSPDLMTYLRVASGYRPGGPNAEATVYGLPDHFDPDRTLNYEIGVKGDALERRISFDMSLYYIDWSRIQVYVSDPVTFNSFNTNAGKAKSEGAELSTTAHPLEGLTLSAWVSWDEAILTHALPATGAYGLPGDRLPYSPRFSGNFSVNQEFPLGADLTGFLGASLAYVGAREGEFQPVPTLIRTTLPPYAKADVRAGLRTGEWTINLFANNITDRRGQLSNVGPLPDGAIRINYMQPRPIGVSVWKTFER